MAEVYKNRTFTREEALGQQSAGLVIPRSRLTCRIGVLSVQIAIRFQVRATQTQTARFQAANLRAVADPTFPPHSTCTPASFRCDSARTQIPDRCGQRSRCTE